MKRYSIAENHGSLVDGDLFSLAESASPMLNRLLSQLQNDVCADGLQPIGVYALLQGQRIPDGLYYYDIPAGELVELPAANSKAFPPVNTTVGSRSEAEALNTTLSTLFSGSAE